MKNKTYFTIGLLLLGLLVALLGCRPDKKDDPVNPCAKAKLPQAVIMVDDGSKEYYPDSTEFFSLDTVDAYAVRFSCTTSYDEYAWTVGTDPKVHQTKSFTLRFNDAYNNIKVQLIGKRKPNECIPNDDGIDTVVKYITTVWPDRRPIHGTYLGYNESDPNTQFVFRFYLTKTPGLWTPQSFFTGLQRDSFVRDSARIDGESSHGFVRGTIHGLSNVRGRIQSDYKTIIIDYGIRDAVREQQGDLSYRQERFIGVKQFNRKD
jgi:hypothetical protein